MSDLAVRHVTTNDTAMLMRWLDDPLTRRWASDDVWLVGIATAVDATSLVIECEGSPMASAHCDQVQTHVWRVNVVIAPGWHSLAGLLAQALLAVEEYLTAHHGVVDTLLTLVHRDNRVAAAMVNEAGFVVRDVSPPYLEFVKHPVAQGDERIGCQYDDVPFHHRTQRR